MMARTVTVTPEIIDSIVSATAEVVNADIEVGAELATGIHQIPPPTYTGPTEVTPTDETQTLETDGLMLAENITIHPIPTDPYDFLGKDPEFVKNLYSAEYALKNTLYKSWTPSTTAKAIVAAVTLPDTYAGDLGEYEYYLRWKFDSDIRYNSGTTMKYVTIRNLMELWQVLAKRPSSRANIEADNFNGNNCSTYFTAGFTDYYDKNGTQTYTWSSSYGFYIAATAATFSNSTSDTPTITIKTPTINARCSTTYFATARAADVDQENSKVKVTGELWRIKKGTSPSRRMHDYLVDLYNNPLIEVEA